MFFPSVLIMVDGYLPQGLSLFSPRTSLNQTHPKLHLQEQTNLGSLKIRGLQLPRFSIQRDVLPLIDVKLSVEYCLGFFLALLGLWRLPLAWELKSTHLQASKVEKQLL